MLCNLSGSFFGFGQLVVFHAMVTVGGQIGF